MYEAVQQHGGIRPAARALGMPESTLRVKLRDYAPGVPEHGFVPRPEEMTPTHTDEKGVETVDRTDRPAPRRFIVTSAQNNCPVHEPFLQNLEALAREVDAEILVGYTIYDRAGYRGVVREGGYRPNRSIWWDQRTRKYAANHRHRLHRRLAFCGELDVLATAKKPLSGLQSYCGRSSILVPHNRFAMQIVPSRKGQMPKEMHTTGSVTRPKFVQRKTGQVAQFHHVLGALLVEVAENGYFYVHHLNAEEDGSFYWLDMHVVDGWVRSRTRPLAALIAGDIHAEKMHWENFLDLKEVVKWAEPEKVILHDLIDFTSRNHHNIKDPVFRVNQQHRTVWEDLVAGQDVLKSVKEIVPQAEVVVARGNHDEALEKWIKTTDWRDDPQNAETYLSLALHMVRAADLYMSGNAPPLLAWAIDARRKLATWLGPDDSFELHGIECGMHGHYGANGARGSTAHFARLGFRTFTAHSHTPAIVDGAYTVGVAGNLDLGYNKGPSSWMHTHGIIYPTGKRAFLHVKGGAWRA